MSGKYYPHNWDAIHEAPSEYFEEISFEDFAIWKINGWDLPSSIACIMRAEHKDTGKIKEHVYKSPKHAVKKLIKLMETGEYRVTVCNHESISIVDHNHDADAD